MVRKKNKVFILFGILALFLLLLPACSSNDASSETESKTNDEKTNDEKKSEDETDATPKEGGAFVVGVADEPDTLDMHKTGMAMASMIGSQIGGALLAVDPDTLEIKPHLAESYEVSDDGKTITLKLQPNVTFHDGTPLTAQAYKDTFDRILNPDTGAVVAGSLVAGVEEVTVPDELTLVIKLSQPSAPFLRNLASSGYLQPMSMEAIEKHGADYGKNPVGIGPWKFESWETGQSILFSRNEDYKWPPLFYENRESARPENLTFKFIKDYQTMLAALDSGSIDLAYNVEAKDAKRYRDNENYYLIEMERQGLGLLIEMNLENEKFQDVNVRKAINMAINKDVIIEASLDGEGSPAYGPISSNLFGYDPGVENYGHKYNPDEAMKLLESSGWSKNSKGIMEKDGQELSFDLQASSNDSQNAQIVQAMLKEIGIEINIQMMESATLIEKAGEGDYEISFMAYSYNDPDVLFILFHSSQIGGLNHVRANNKELDALLEQARVAMDPEERNNLYVEAQKIIVEEAYWVPVYSEKIFHIVNSRLQNVKSAPTELLYHDSWIDE